MLIVLIMVTLFGAMATAAAAAFGKRQTSLIESRIADFRNRTTSRDNEFGPDLEAAFSERVLKPGAESIARLFSKVLPQSVLEDVRKNLAMAGYPMKFNTYLTMWLGFIAAFGLIGLFLLFGGGGALSPQKLGVAVVFLILGYTMPRFWLKSKVKSKQQAVLKALPDTLDLITTCVEAGLGLDAALSRVAEKGDGPLAMELQHMLRDVAMGKLRREAMTELGERAGVTELTNFINAIIQAEQLGVGIAQVLRVQADQLRTQRRQRAERQAHEAPIKMLFPPVLFVFPAFLAVILGPAMIQIAKAFSWHLVRRSGPFAKNSD
jgi:tight adherence protein C